MSQPHEPWGTPPPEPWPSQPGPWSPHAPWPAPAWPPPAARPRLRPAAWAALGALGMLVVVGLVGLGVAAAGFGREAVESMTVPAPVGAVQTSPPTDPAGLGDDPGMDGYAQRCHEGDMSACDDLYELSDPMSRYEHYGLTCGGRVKPFEVTWCADIG